MVLFSCLTPMVRPVQEVVGTSSKMAPSAWRGEGSWEEQEASRGRLSRRKDLGLSADGRRVYRISAKGDFLYMHPWLVMLDVDEMARIGSDRVLMACGSAELEIESCWVDVTRALGQSETTATPRQAPLPGVFPSVQAKLVVVEEKKVLVQVKSRLVQLQPANERSNYISLVDCCCRIVIER